MPRVAREKSSTKIYHIMLRGINKQSIFEDDEDYEKFIQTLSDCKQLSGFELYGYCLMGNHVHLLLKIGREELEQIFKRLGSRYVYWYNNKYARCGHLFQDRFKSEAVEDGKYFIKVLRYIHQNPLIAKICDKLEDYRWSSYNDYIRKKGIVDYEYALTIIKEKSFIDFMNEKNHDRCLEFEEKNKRITDVELIIKIEEMFKIKAIMIQNEPRDKMEQLLKRILEEIEGVSTRQLSRVTGVSMNIIWRL